MITLAVAPLTKTFLIAIRLGTVVLFSPIEAIRLLPVHTRLILVLILSAIMMANVTMPDGDLDDLSLVSGAICELCNGLILSLSLYACFAVFQIAGQLIDTQMGLNSLAILNPADHSHDPLSSRLLMMLAVLFFFALNGHQKLIQNLALSFTLIPPGKPLVFDGFSPIIQQFSLMFSFGFMLAAPIVIGLLIVDISAAVLTRNMPQISTYFLSLPVKIMLGFFMFILLLNYVSPFMDKLFQLSAQSFRAVMR